MNISLKKKSISYCDALHRPSVCPNHFARAFSTCAGGRCYRPFSFFWIWETTSHVRHILWPRWVSKTLFVPDSYKKCTSWLKLKTCCVDLKPFAITQLQSCNRRQNRSVIELKQNDPMYLIIWIVFTKTNCYILQENPDQAHFSWFFTEYSDTALTNC